MKYSQIKPFVHQYLEATGCTILEKGSEHMKVKLSPEADKDLTNRPYYWSFVERTGAEPETMTYTFVFDEEAYEAYQKEQKNALQNDDFTQRKQTSSPSNQPLSNDHRLQRKIGYVPPVNRIKYDHLHYGSSRLQQIFQTVKQKGKYVLLFEEPDESKSLTSIQSYTSWLGANYNVEYTCDMKRSELYSLGISLSTGEIVTNFQQYLNSKKLTPRLPARTHVKETISLPRAVQELERYLEKKITAQDDQWSYEAQIRMEEEKKRIQDYYEEMLERVESDEKPAVEQEYENRLREMEWQYKPRITASVINCGIFNLLEDTLRQK